MAYSVGMRKTTPDRLPDPEQVLEGSLALNSSEPEEYLGWLDEKRKNLKDEDADSTVP